MVGAGNDCSTGNLHTGNIGKGLLTFQNPHLGERILRVVYFHDTLPSHGAKLNRSDSPFNHTIYPNSFRPLCI